MVSTTVSRRGSLHEHYNHRRGFGKKRVFGVCGGWCRTRATAAGSRARGVCAVAGAGAGRHRGGDGGLQPLRAVQLLLGHSKLESTVRYLGIEIDDALEMAEQTEA